MKYLSSFSRLSLLLLTLSAAACGNAGSTSDVASRGPSPSTPPSSAGDPGAERAIAEADIIQLDGGRLYAMSKSGSVAVVDVSQPGRLALLGRTNIAGEPFEMYRRGDRLVAMSNRAASDGSSAAVIVLDVASPAQIHAVEAFPVPGEVADSRVVGDVLYLATYENARCLGCGDKQRTLVTTFDIARPAAMTQVDQVVFESNAPDGFNLPWGSNWKRSIFVTPERLYIGGHADIEPSQLDQGAHQEGIIDVLDVTDPGGHLRRGPRIEVAGALLSRWQIDERQGMLRVITQRGAGRTGNGIGDPNVDVFRIDGAGAQASFTSIGHTTITMPRQEGLRAVRFDDDRAYAITYNQTDPLFTIDLRDPTAPRQRGELHMPGFMFHLEPHGDRLIGLGVDRDDPGGSLNVSLFDVADMDAPSLLKRVSFGAAKISEDYLILNYEVPEDQDRIQKAFRVFDDGLVVVPFSTGQGCGENGGAVQLVDWSNDTLTKRALLPMRGNARRAFQHEGELLAVSDSNVRSFSLAATRSGAAAPTADVEIGACVARTIPGGYNGSFGGSERGGRYDDRSYGDHDSRNMYRCAASAGVGAGRADGALVALALVAGTVLVRRRRA
ncbi:MAG: beta-propeller domain-containing protein [Labilithrix sp.]|nr:beta-propeller domain-containing protein [Labilithrix sp.]